MTVLLSTYVNFTGNIGSDTTAPVFQSASFNTGTKALTVNFNEKATIADMTKITLSDGTVSLTLKSTETKTSDNNTTDVITLADSATLTTLATMSGTNWTITLAAGAFKDANNNLTAALPATAMTSSLPPLVKSASYDETTAQLTVVFTKPVKVATMTDLSNITITAAGVNSATVTGGMAVKAGTAATTDTIVFTMTNAAALEMNNNRANAATAGAYKVKFADNSIKDANDVALATGSGSEVNSTYTKDEVAPELSSAAYDSGTKKMTLTFSQRLTGTIDSSKFAIYYDNSGTKTVLDTNDDTSSLKAGAGNTTGGLTVSSDGLTATATLQGNLATKIAAQKAKALYVKVLAANGMADLGDNALKSYDATTYPTMAPITYTDAEQGTVSSISYLSANKIAVNFSKSMDKTSLETTANYAIAQTTNPANTRTVTAAALSTDGKQVVLTLNANLTGGVAFTLTMSNLKDSLGYALATASATQALSLSTSNPELLTTTYIDNGDNVKSAGDRIELKFDQPIKLVSGQTIAAADFNTFGGANFGTSAPSLTISGDTLVITLNSVPTIDFTANSNAGPEIYATGDAVSAKITNLGGDKTIKATTANNARCAAPNTTAPVMNTAVLNDVNGNGVIDKGDKITVTFANTIATVNALTANEQATKHFTLTDGGGTNNNVVAEFTGTTSGTTAVLTLTDNAIKDNLSAAISHLTAGAIKVKIDTTATEITNTWGIKTAVAKSVDLTSTDSNAPAIQSVTYTDYGTAGNSTGDVITVKFTKPINVSAVAANMGDFVAVTGTGAISGGGFAATAYTVGVDTVAFKVTTLGSLDIVPGTTQIRLNSASSTSLFDASGNPVIRTAGVTVTAGTKDTTAPSTPVVSNTASNYINSANAASYTVSGTAEAGSIVAVTLADSNGAPNIKTGSFVANASGAWSGTIDTTGAGALIEGNVTITATTADAAGNTSSASTPVVVVKDITGPTATVTTTNATTLVVTYSTELYNNGTAIANGADVKALFTYNGTLANYTSATYNATAKTVTFVINGEDTKTLTTSANVKDAYGNAVPATDDVFTFTAPATWAKG